MPWGTRWVLGGGNKKKGLAAVREAAAMATDEFSHAEAEFALWDMLLRDKNIPEATEVAQTHRAGVSGEHRSRGVPAKRRAATSRDVRVLATAPVAGTIWMMVLKRAGCAPRFGLR